MRWVMKMEEFLNIFFSPLNDTGKTAFEYFKIWLCNHQKIPIISVTNYLSTVSNVE